MYSKYQSLVRLSFIVFSLKGQCREIFSLYNFFLSKTLPESHINTLKQFCKKRYCGYSMTISQNFSEETKTKFFQSLVVPCSIWSIGISIVTWRCMPSGLLASPQSRGVACSISSFGISKVTWRCMQHLICRHLHSHGQGMEHMVCWHLHSHVAWHAAYGLLASPQSHCVACSIWPVKHLHSHVALHAPSRLLASPWSRCIRIGIQYTCKISLKSRK